jgi:DNA-binding transcriptional LysR family regulator
VKLRASHRVWQLRVAITQTGEFDCGIVVMPEGYPELSRYRTLPLGTGHLRLLMRREHALAEKRILNFGDLKEQALIFVAKEQNPALHIWLEDRGEAGTP